MVSSQQEEIIHSIKVPRSNFIKGMKYLTEPSIYPNSCGDIWSWTWADDDNIYIFGGDLAEIEGKIGQSIKVEGIPPNHKCIALGNKLTTGNWPLRRSFLDNTDYWAMPCGSICMDGRIYLFVNKNLENGEQWEKKRNSVGILAPHYPHYQPVSKAYLLYSDNYGVTWIGDAKDRDPEFFPHKFAWPTFINFGKNYENARDNYVYATSNDGYWDNGRNCYLGRVPRFKIFDRDYWEFYVGMSDDTPIWTKDLDKAVPIFSDPNRNFPPSSEFGHIGSFEITYNRGLKRYLMLIWSYAYENGFEERVDVKREEDHPYFCGSEIQIYESDEPWGPWSLVHNEYNFGSPAGYNPRFPTKWMSPDGRVCWMLYSGNWQNLTKPGSNKNIYGVVTRQCEFELEV